MSSSQKDPGGDEGTNHHLTEPTRDVGNNKQKAASRQNSLDEDAVHGSSNSINGDGTTSYFMEVRSLSDIEADNLTPRVDQNAPASETDRRPTDEQAGLPRLDSTSTVRGLGEGEILDPPVAANPSSESSAEQADRRGAVDMPSIRGLGKEGDGVERRHGQKISRNTGFIMTVSDIPKDHEDHQPPAAARITKSSKRKQNHTGQARRKWYLRPCTCVCIIFGLIVVAVVLACAHGCKSSSVEIQKSCELMFEARAGITSVYVWMLYATKQLYQRLSPFDATPRNSSGKELSAGLSQTNTNLSEALAAGDLLYQAPALISERRAEAKRFQLPEESFTSKPLHLFLHQSTHIDEDLLRLILDLGQLASLALRQHQHTTDTLHSIQRIQFFWTFDWFKIQVSGISTQEEQLKRRLEEHLRLLDEKVTVVDRIARKVLQDYIKLESTADVIRESSLQDKQRLLSMKEQAASELNWLVRASIQLLGLPEPEDLAKISRNVELAQNIHEWAQNIVDVLQRVISHLKYAKANIGSLMATIGDHGTVTWDLANKNRTILEFLAQSQEGWEPLQYNVHGWVQLQLAGHI